MRQGLALVVSLALLLGVPGSILAAQTSCIGGLAPGSYANLHVPAGAYCTLRSGTVINGNLEVRGSLRAHGITIDGNVKKEGPGFLTLVGSSVKGNVEINGGGALVAYTSINGNLTVERVWGANIVANVVGGNVEIRKSNGQVTISGNTIGGNLKVEESGAQIMISGNRISGNLDCDQCVAFQAVAFLSPWRAAASRPTSSGSTAWRIRRVRLFDEV